MKLPKFVIRCLTNRMEGLTERKPDYIIGKDGDHYMERWWVIPKNKFFNIYLHKIIRSDDDRALHSHPWMNISILLKGSYIEHTIKQGGTHYKTKRVSGDLIFRMPSKFHRLEVENNYPTMTLFITGPRVKEWYFACKDFLRPWYEFVDPNKTGQRGKGCD